MRQKMAQLQPSKRSKVERSVLTWSDLYGAPHTSRCQRFVSYSYWTGQNSALSNRDHHAKEHGLPPSFTPDAAP